MSFPAFAQTVYQEQVRQQLLAAAISLLTVGFQITHEPRMEGLPRGQIASFELVLQEGFEYAILGVCDSDCRDIDLQLYDENANLVDEDLLIDNQPVVTVQPAWTGRFYIDVSIPDCRARRCTYGLLVLAR